MKVPSCIKFVCVFQWLKNFSSFQFSGLSARFLFEAFSLSWLSKRAMHTHTHTQHNYSHARWNSLDKWQNLLLLLLLGEWDSLSQVSSSSTWKMRFISWLEQRNFFSRNKNQNLHSETFFSSPPLEEELFCSNWRERHVWFIMFLKSSDGFYVQFNAVNIRMIVSLTFNLHKNINITPWWWWWGSSFLSKLFASRKLQGSLTMKKFGICTRFIKQVVLIKTAWNGI